MFAARFFGAAMLAALVPCASAAEPVWTSFDRYSFNAPSRPSPATGLLSSDSLAATRGELATLPWVETASLQSRTSHPGDLAAGNSTAAQNGAPAIAQLLTPRRAGDAAFALPASMSASPQVFMTPSATTQPAPIWVTVRSLSALMARPTTEATVAR